MGAAAALKLAPQCLQAGVSAQRAGEIVRCLECQLGLGCQAVLRRARAIDSSRLAFARRSIARLCCTLTRGGSALTVAKRLL